MKLSETALPLPRTRLRAEAKGKMEGAEFFFDFLVDEEEAKAAAASSGDDGSDAVAFSAGFFSVSSRSASCRMGRRPFCSFALHSM